MILVADPSEALVRLHPFRRAIGDAIDIGRQALVDDRVVGHRDAVMGAEDEPRIGEHAAGETRSGLSISARMSKLREASEIRGARTVTSPSNCVPG